MKTEDELAALRAEVARLRAELDKAAAIIVKVNGHNSRLLQERHNLKAKGEGHG